jgi:exonuclease III
MRVVAWNIRAGGPVFSEREEGWIDALTGCGWLDAFRHLRADARAYTWYSPNGRNGFRIDQAFVNTALLAHLADAAYVWGGATRRGRRDALSDHAALLVDLDEGQAGPSVVDSPLASP